MSLLRFYQAPAEHQPTAKSVPHHCRESPETIAFETEGLVCSVFCRSQSKTGKLDLHFVPQRVKIVAQECDWRSQILILYPCIKRKNGGLTAPSSTCHKDLKSFPLKCPSPNTPLPFRTDVQHPIHHSGQPICCRVLCSTCHVQLAVGQQVVALVNHGCRPPLSLMRSSFHSGAPKNALA